MILLDPPLLLHDLELIPNFVLGKALHRLLLNAPLVPLVHGSVEGFIFKGGGTDQAMMMVMHGSNILINQGILSIMMMMCVRTQLTGASLSHRAASLCEHHYFVVFLAHQRWGRGHTYFHQRLLKSNAWALKGGEITASDWIQTI